MTKLKNLIEQARREGLTVRVRRESDGSGETRVRVVSINGKKYSKSQGNTALRKMMGEELSERQKAQRRQANVSGETAEEQGAQREKHKADKTLPKMTKKEKARLRRMNRMVQKTGHGFRMSSKQYRKMKKARGKEGTEQQMRRRETASRGDVYSEKVDEYLAEMRYVISMEKPGAKYARKIIAFFNRHGRVGKDGRYAFFKGHSISDEAYYAARRKTYELTKDKANDALMEACTKEALDILQAGVKIDGKLVN